MRSVVAAVSAFAVLGCFTASAFGEYVRTGSVRGLPNPPSYLAFSPDGGSLYSLGQETSSRGLREVLARNPVDGGPVGATYARSELDGVAVAGDGRVLVGYGGDANVGPTVLTFSSDLAGPTAWGNYAPDGSRGAALAKGVAVDVAGFVYTADSNNGRVFKFTSDGQLLGTFGAPGRGPGRFGEGKPERLAVDGVGHVFADDGTRIEEFSDSGTAIREWAGPGIVGSIAADARHVYAVGTGGFEVFDLSGRFVSGLSAPGDALSVAVRPDGRVYLGGRYARDDFVHVYSQRPDPPGCPLSVDEFDAVLLRRARRADELFPRLPVHPKIHPCMIRISERITIGRRRFNAVPAVNSVGFGETPKHAPRLSGAARHALVGLLRNRRVGRADLTIVGRAGGQSTVIHRHAPVYLR
jgi:hypothetical protein